MNALWDSLPRKQTHRFVFLDGSTLDAVFHEINPDGTLLVGSVDGTHRLNPNAIAAAWQLTYPS